MPFLCSLDSLDSGLGLYSISNLTLQPFVETFLAFSYFQYQDVLMTFLADGFLDPMFCAGMLVESEKVVSRPKIFVDPS